MKKIVDDWRLIYKVCSLYYEDDMRQQEISDYLGISRATISRMLQKGKESGIVRVEVVNPIQFTYGKLEKTLERKYGLKDVIVVENSSLDTRQESLNKMYEKAALYLSQFFRDGDYIGVSMGFTLHNVARTRRSFAKDNQYMFVPIVGGISPNSINGVDVQSNQIAREFADKFGGSYTQFLAPAQFSDKKIKDYFLEEKSVNFIFDDFEKLDTVVMGIGANDTGTDSTLVHAGYITDEELQSFADNGVVGNVALQFFDSEGKREKFQGFNERVAGMPADQIKKIRNRIGIAGGVERVKAVKGAIAGGYINILITNNECAEKLL